MELLLALLFFTPPEAAQAYREGVALFEQGRAAEALPLLERAAGLDERNAQYWKVVGVARAKLADYRGSVEPFGKACKLNPRLVDACYYHGRSLYASDLYQEALAPLRQALAVDTVKGRAETAIGQCQEALGEEEGAERTFRSAVGRNDGWAQSARLAYGRFLVRQGRAAEAVPVLEAAQQPESADARYELGLALSQCDRLAEAVRELERAPDHEAARLLLGKVKARLAAPRP